MKLIVNRDFPEAVLRFLEQGFRKPNPKRMSVTDLINPPLIRTLKIRHFDEIEVDVDEEIWKLFGTALDELLAKHAPEEARVKEKFEIDMGIPDYDKITLVGEIDLHHKDILSDYKFTSVWKFMKGDQRDWEKQLNVYAYMLGLRGIRVSKIEVDIFLRDRRRGEAKKYHDYPKYSSYKKEFPLWSITEQANYIDRALIDHMTNPERPCTPEERWQKQTTYAVMKEGRKTASRVLNSREEAEKWILINTPTVRPFAKYVIEERAGEDTRCMEYCPVRTVCPYNKYNTGGSYENSAEERGNDE